MRLVDSHCHLAHPRLRHKVQEVLSRATAGGVAACICASGDLAEATAAMEIARQNEGVYFTAGIHPHESQEAPADFIRQLESMLAAPKCVALGEIGLDYHYDFSPRDAQRRIFAQQLELAASQPGGHRPIVIHTREAFDDTLAIIRDAPVDTTRLAFHSFTEDIACARRIISMGCMIGLSGIATFKKAQHLRDIAKCMPANQLLIETDAPYLSPEPVRSMKDNEPANVAHVAACLADARGAAVEDLAELTTRNAQRFFGLLDQS